MMIQTERLEFFKLDAIDRKVLFWLMDNVHHRSVKSWMEYIAKEYHERGIAIDAARLFEETQQWDEGSI